MAQPKTRVAVIKEFFPQRGDQSKQEYFGELKALTSEERDELAVGAAKAMGLTQDDVTFPLN